MANKRKVKITETIFRDAHQSLLATRMSTDDMLPIAEKINKVGYHSRSEEHTSELQSRPHLVCRLLLEKKKSDRARSPFRRPARRLRPCSPSVHTRATAATSPEQRLPARVARPACEGRPPVFYAAPVPD